MLLLGKSPSSHSRTGVGEGKKRRSSGTGWRLLLGEVLSQSRGLGAEKSLGADQGVCSGWEQRKASEEVAEEILRAECSEPQPEFLLTNQILPQGLGKHVLFHPLSKHLLSPYFGPEEAGRQGRQGPCLQEVHSPLEETDESNCNYNVNLHFLSARQPG